MNGDVEGMWKKEVEAYFKITFSVCLEI